MKRLWLIVKKGHIQYKQENSANVPPLKRRKLNNDKELRSPSVSPTKVKNFVFNLIPSIFI